MITQCDQIVVTGKDRQLRPLTEPLTEPEPGMVVVRTEASGVSYGDILFRAGAVPGTPKPPFTPGFDVTGVVHKLGPDVVGLTPGQRVTALLPQGGYAEYVTVPAHRLVPVPAGLSAVSVAGTVLNHYVARQLLRVAAPRPDGQILVHGAGQGVGRALVERARLKGLRVFGTAAAGLGVVEALGAQPIDYRSEDFVAVLRAAGGADAAFDALGGRNFGRSYRALRRGGTLVGYGVAAAYSNGRARPAVAVASMLRLFSRTVLPDGRQCRFYTATGSLKQIGAYRADLSAVLAALAAGQIQPAAVQTLPLAAAAHAHQLMESGQARGKLVLVCHDDAAQAAGS